MNLFETAFRALKSISTSPRPGEASGETTTTTRKPDVSAGIPHYNKGMILERRGDKTSAMDHYREAIKAAPDYFDAHANLGRLLCEAERWDDAILHCQAAIRLNPNSPKVHNNIAAALYQKNQVTESLKHFTTALRLVPDDMVVFENLNEIRKHHPEFETSEAVAEAKFLCSQLADKHYAYGFQSMTAGQTAQALDCWRTAVRFEPQWADLLSNLAWILATHPEAEFRKGKEALDLATRAFKLDSNQPRYMDTLAAAYAECGRFDDARKFIELAIPIVKIKGPLDLAERLPERMKLYTQNKPLREFMPHIRPAKRTPSVS